MMLIDAVGGCKILYLFADNLEILLSVQFNVQAEVEWQGEARREDI